MTDPAAPSDWARRITGVAEWAWPDHPPRWREVPGRLRPTLSNVTRLTTAAVVSYLFTLLTTKGAIDLTGALTALLVVQASAYSTIKTGIVRVGAVLSGVLVATLLSNWIGLTWWSLGAVIASSLLLAKVLRLGDQALETPISAMLILGVANHDVAAEIRILNTLIGAGVGVALNLLYPPALPTAPAGRALLRVVDAAATPLSLAGEAFANGPVTREDVEAWTDRARAANIRVAEATEAMAALKDSRLMNPRALGTVDVEPVLTTGLEALEHCLLATRALFAVVLAELPDEEDPEDPYGEELRSAFSVVLHDLADCLRAFGGLVVAEAEGREEETEQALAESLEILRETQAILTELIMVVTQDDSAWLLRGSILAAVGEVLTRLNLEDRARMHKRWKEEQQRRPMAQLPLIIQGVLPHPDRPYPRALEGLVWRKPRPDDVVPEEPRPPDDVTHPAAPHGPMDQPPTQ